MSSMEQPLIPKDVKKDEDVLGLMHPIHHAARKEKRTPAPVSLILTNTFSLKVSVMS